MPILADHQRITGDLSRILRQLSFAKRYVGFAAAALAAPAVFFLFSRAGGPGAMVLGGAFFGYLWWVLRFWALRRAVRAFDERFPEWSSERPVVLEVLKTMTAEPGAERLYAALVMGPATELPQGITKAIVHIEPELSGFFGGSAALETLLKKFPEHLTITQTSVNGKVELLVHGEPVDVDDPQLLELILIELEELKASAIAGAQGDQPADQKVQNAVAALDTGFEPIPIQGKGTGKSQPAGASGSASSQKAPRWMPLQPDEHRPTGEPGENAEGK